VTTANNLGNVTLTLAGNGTSGTAPGTASAQNFSIDLVGVVSQGTNSTLSLVVATTGLGAVSLNANSTFSGGVWVKSGIVTMNSALSAGNGTITLGDTSGSANAALKRGSTTGANAITVAAGSSGTLSIESNSNTNPVYSGLVTMSNNLTLATGATGGSLTMNGGFTGSGNLTLLAVGGTVAVTTNDINMNGTITNNGSGSGAVTISSSIGSNVTGVIQNSTTSSLVLSGVNTYGGTTVANSRFIDVRNNLALQNTVVDTTGSGAFTFNASSSTPTLGGLSGAVNLATKFSSGFTSVTSLTLNPQTGVSASYSGNITNGATGMTLTKTGNGTQVLSGVNTYTGGTLVSVGTLIVNNTSGSGTGTGNVTVAAGAVLGGEGIITPGTGRSISVSGVLSPGNSGAIGTLTLNGGSTTLPLASFASGASFEFQLDATTVTSDRISLTSGAAGDIAFNNNNIAFTLNGSLVTGQTYTLFTSNVAGAFTGLTFVDGKVTSGLTFSGLSGAFQSDSYISQSGNNLVLNAVPEPATWALLALGFAAFVFLRRQRA
jgi:autotransporter-associated beta strand protein